MSANPEYEDPLDFYLRFLELLRSCQQCLYTFHFLYLERDKRIYFFPSLLMMEANRKAEVTLCLRPSTHTVYAQDIQWRDTSMR